MNDQFDEVSNEELTEVDGGGVGDIAEAAGYKVGEWLVTAYCFYFNC
jgi:hypothetical protein